MSNEERVTSKMKEVAIIVAAAANNGIGKDNTIPWDIPEELNNFRLITSSSNVPNKQNAIIMGRNTWQSLPHKPLKNRVNIVVSNSMQEGNDEGYILKRSIYNALLHANADDNIAKIFIIGGAEIYREVLERHVHLVDKIYLSVIYDKEYHCDKFIDMNKIYDCFEFDKENIHLTERYMFMIGNNKKVCKTTLANDEHAD